jgi:hypothetical protein
LDREAVLPRERRRRRDAASRRGEGGAASRRREGGGRRLGRGRTSVGTVGVGDIMAMADN